MPRSIYFIQLTGHVVLYSLLELVIGMVPFILTVLSRGIIVPPIMIPLFRTAKLV